MARGPAEREVANIPEPEQRSDDGGHDEGVSILLTSDKASGDEKNSQRSEANSEDFQDPQGIDSDKNIHYLELPASSHEDGSSKSHDKGGNTGQRSLKSPPGTPDTLLPPLSFHPLLEDYEDDNESDFEYSSDDENDTNMSHPPTLSLTEASRIKPLQGRDNWVEWDEQLQAQLGMLDLYEILTDPTKEPNRLLAERQYRKWEEYQRRLKGLLLCITGPHPKSLLMNNQGLTAVRQYGILRREYNSQTITTFSQLYRKIDRCSIANHKSLKEYCDEFIKTRNKLQQLGHPIDPLHLICAFLDGLDESYQGWKDQLFSYYISNATRNIVTSGGQTQTVMNIPIMEEVIKQLMDREDGLVASTLSADMTRAFGARGTSAPKPSKQGSSSQSPRCYTCGGYHLKSACYFSNWKDAPEFWRTRYDTPEKRAAELENTRKRFKWEPSSPKPESRAYIAFAISATGRNKDSNWYADCAASSHLTHDISLFISTDLDNNSEEILAADGVILRTRGSGTIALATLVNGKRSFKYISLALRL